MTRDNTTPLDYASSHPALPIPEYREIETGASLVQIAGHFALAVGIVLVLLAAVLFFAAFDRGVYAMSAGIGGVALVIAGVFMRMTASLSLAIRDMARNSFR